MFRLLVLAALGWIGYRIIQENSEKHPPMALIPSPEKMRRQAKRAKAGLDL
jgi:putative NADH-flavin reductase